MKRTATTIALLAGLGGGCMNTDGSKTSHAGGFGTVTKPATAKGVQGPAGEPVTLTTTARGAMPGGPMPSTVVQASGYRAAGAKSPSTIRGYVPGLSTVDSRVIQVNGNQPYGPPQGGILPVPGMGPPGAVAAVGAINPMMRMAPTNQRTSIRFTGPDKMQITWQVANGTFTESALTAPVDYNFVQGQVYRLKLSGAALKLAPGRSFFPTLELAPVTPKTMTYLAHASVPITFADEDFRQAADGNLVVKVIYLPDPAFQDFAALGGADEIVSTRLEPGADPVAEAQKRGTILAVVRLGNIDLDNKYSPSMTAPPPMQMGPPPVMGPRPMPPLAKPKEEESPASLPPVK